jgi:F-type H+-transporting ATPase subunit delta
VRAQQIAGIYAKAFLGAAVRAGQLEERVTELEYFIRDVLNELPQFNALLCTSLVKHEQRIGILDRALGGRVSAPFLDFLKVLSKHDRLGVLREIGYEARSQCDVLLGRVPVRVSTATPLSAADAEKLVPALRALLKGEPDVELAVDPALIGGLVLRIGDTVYDGSVARQLAQVRKQMINRSVHEIQSRRDSFRSAGGN